jgi:hypothetical protein
MLDHAAVADAERLHRKASAGGILPSESSLLSLLGAGLAAFHGYKRNDESIPWALGWGLLGYNFPILTVGAAAYEGFGKSAPNAGFLQKAPG